MRNKLKLWIHRQKLKLAERWLAAVGLVAVQIVERAGSDYLVLADGTFMRIGGKNRR